MHKERHRMQFALSTLFAATIACAVILTAASVLPLFLVTFSLVYISCIALGQNYLLGGKWPRSVSTSIGALFSLWFFMEFRPLGDTRDAFFIVLWGGLGGHRRRVGEINSGFLGKSSCNCQSSPRCVIPE